MDNEIITTPERTGASFNRGASKQDYATPDDFRGAVVRRWGMPAVDLACSPENRFGNAGITEPEDSLSLDWSNLIGTDIGWLNPPFSNIAPWAEKCASSGSKILFLVPAAVGSNWFREHVNKKAMVLGINGRLCFDGKNPYPKDCILCLFGFGYSGFDVWEWKRGAVKEMLATA